MLRKRLQNPKLGYSKAPRGLSVLMQVNRVFTVIPISPSLSPRQRFFRYAFRAGRNLPDKEFRSTLLLAFGLYLHPIFIGV